MTTPVSRAEQAMWDARKILGFDNDGDPTPAAVLAGGGRESFCQRFLLEVQEFVDETGQAEEEAWDEGYRVGKGINV